MTMNTLPYPYNGDKPDATEDDMEMKQYDQSAFNARMKRIKLEHSYMNTDKFPLSLTEFAHLLLKMYDKFDTIEKPKVPVFSIFE